MYWDSLQGQSEFRRNGLLFLIQNIMCIPFSHTMGEYYVLEYKPKLNLALLDCYISSTVLGTSHFTAGLFIHEGMRQPWTCYNEVL